MVLPYGGEKGLHFGKILEERKTLPSNIQAEIVYNNTKLSSLLNSSKDVTAFEENHDVVYRSDCATADCNADYIGECARRLNERVKDHNDRN